MSKVLKIKIDWVPGTYLEDAIKIAEDIVCKYNCKVEFDFTDLIYFDGHKLIPTYDFKFIKFKEVK